MEISTIIRRRIESHRRTFFCNDYIGDFITKTELIELQQEVEDKVQGLLNSLVIDTQSDHNTKDTAKRMAKMYIKEVLAGRYTPKPDITEFPNYRELNDMYILSPIKVRSMCSHHFVPILGDMSIGIIPNEKLIGISKFARIAEWILNRGHIQEEAIVMLANELEDMIQPKGLAIILKAEHLCMKWRGVKQENTMMTSSIMRGMFMESAIARSEFLHLIGDKI